MIKDVLAGIRRGTTTDVLARELDLKRSTLLARLEFLVDEGHLTVVGVQCSCAPSCPGCAGATDAGSDRPRIYTLTTKGERFIEQKD